VETAVAHFFDDDGVAWEAQFTGRYWIAGSQTKRGVQFKLTVGGAEWVFYGSIVSGLDLNSVSIEQLRQSLSDARAESHENSPPLTNLGLKK
jgi:hypothetical protein